MGIPETWTKKIKGRLSETRTSSNQLLSVISSRFDFTTHLSEWEGQTMSVLLFPFGRRLR